MWAMSPWYLVRSLVSVGFAFLLAMGTALVYIMIADSAGVMNDDSAVLGSFPIQTRYYILCFLGLVLYLLILWLAPWGAATRRGGAYILNSFAPSDSGRRNLVMGILVVGVVFFILTFAGAMPLPDLSPFGN